MKLAEVKRAEKEYHERYYYSDEPLSEIDVKQFHENRFQPCYTTGTHRYTDNDAVFYELIRSQGGWTDKVVLDYACGPGKWSVYYALTGAKKVFGFDLAESGVRRGQNLAVRQGVGGVVSLTAMDASSLAFADNSFEVVIGNGVLHHVLKYPDIFEELYRVMKPGAKAYFHEGLADFLPFKVYWKLKGDVEEGDIPIHAKEIRRLASMFSDVQVIGDTFFFSVKTFLWKPNASKATRFVLKMCKTLDDCLFTVLPPLRAWGSFSYIVLTK